MKCRKLKPKKESQKQKDLEGKTFCFVPVINLSGLDYGAITYQVYRF